MDGMAELVAGALSSDPERAHASAEDLFVPRSYGSFEEMATKEAKLPADQRIDFVVIVTPNHQHFAPAKTFLEAGFHVILDKPVTFDLPQALELRKIVKARSEEHTSELQSLAYLVCRLLLEKKKNNNTHQ